ncbi:hypothetical protein GQ602_002384 [Ophiocordyceps camponoti-floridani]|uniref:Uncharacterized protein n=1 Tax=Ophiocordyceps camponoti-floridani TaxID=2030778 RepID=A0A8H4QAC5_9HYPO|nr:hypothetical protein GQ602_002384 [Ophiocordyceps camponoti-floridani]
MRAALILLPAIVTSRFCKRGFHYCGSTLLQVGLENQQRMEQAVESQLGKSNRPASLNHCFFYCEYDGRPGQVRLDAVCPYGCVDAGRGLDDYCHLP